MIYLCAYSGERLNEIKKEIYEKVKDLEDYFLLSTCQRIELYTLNEVDFTFGKMSKGNSVIKHLTLLATGSKSGLFGEIEIYNQISNSFEKAEREKHLSSELRNIIRKCLENAMILRKKYEITTSWTEKVLELISAGDKVLVIGEGNLANKLRKKLRQDKIVLNKIEPSVVVNTLNEIPRFAGRNLLLINLNSKINLPTKYNLDYFFDLESNKEIQNRIIMEVENDKNISYN